MIVLDILKILASLSLMAFGLLSLAQPKLAASLIHTQTLDARGVAEMRVNMGGFFVGLGLVPVLLNDPDAYLVAGGAYLAAAGARLMAYVLDKPVLNAEYVGVFAFELLMGVILIV